MAKCVRVQMQVPVESKEGKALLRLLGLGPRPRKYESNLIDIDASLDWTAAPRRKLIRTIEE